MRGEILHGLRVARTRLERLTAPGGWGRARARGSRRGGSTPSAMSRRRRSIPWSDGWAAFGAHVHGHAHGRDDRAAVPEREAKSIGSEHTFDVDDGGDAAPRPGPGTDPPAGVAPSLHEATPWARIEIASDDQ